MLATFRPSRQVKIVWRVANMSATSACRARRILENDTTHGQTGKEDMNELVRCGKLNEEVASILVMLRGCYEVTAPVEFTLNIA